MDYEESLMAPLHSPPLAEAPPPSRTALPARWAPGGPTAMLGLGLMLGGLVGLTWALTGRFVAELGVFGLGALAVGGVAWARISAAPTT